MENNKNKKKNNNNNHNSSNSLVFGRCPQTKTFLGTSRATKSANPFKSSFCWECGKASQPVARVVFSLPVVLTLRWSRPNLLFQLPMQVFTKSLHSHFFLGGGAHWAFQDLETRHFRISENLQDNNNSSFCFKPPKISTPQKYSNNFYVLKKV